MVGNTLFDESQFISGKKRDHKIHNEEKKESDTDKR